MPATPRSFTPQRPPTSREVRELIADIDAYLRGDEHTEEWDPDPLLTRAAALLAVLQVPPPTRA